MHVLVALVSLASFSLAQMWPATIPVAVRTPHLNSYIRTPAGGDYANSWPQLWDLEHVLAWDAWIMVDGGNLQLFGNGSPKTNLTKIELTPTRSILTIQAGAMNVTLTFLSPIEPDNLVLQSLPFVYMYVDAQSLDGQPHNIQFYSDVTAEWLSEDLKSPVTWGTVKSDSLLYHHASRTTTLPMGEINDMAEDATLYYAFPNGEGVTYRTGFADISRTQWANNKTLGNTEDTRYRAINDLYPTYSFALDLGNTTGTSQSIMWALGLTRDPSIKYTAQERYPYYRTKYDSIDSAIPDFVDDFEDARDRAVAFDKKVVDAAREISQEYADLVAIAARQAIAGVEITVSQSSGGDWDESDIMTFMKDVGISRRVNPVDTMYAAFPAFLTINATWAGYLLRPLLHAQRNSVTGVDYALPDLGSEYPTATVNFSPPKQGALENTGDMLIMVWAHAIFSGDATLIKEYYGLFKKWTDHLVSVKPSSSTSGFTDTDGVNNANLAFKAILGVRCMAAISDAVGRDDDSDTYSAHATSLFNEWEGNALLDNHIVSEYGTSSSWGLIYNMYYDVLLGTSLVEDSIITQQDSFYANKLSSAGDFGVVYDSSVRTATKSTWSIFVAGATKDTGVRDAFVSGVHAKLLSNASGGVFPTEYSSSTGQTTGGVSSPSQGALFSLLALRMERMTPTGGGDINDSSTPGGSESDEEDGSPNVGAIAGGVIAGVVVIGLLAVGAFIWRRRQQRLERTKDGRTSSFEASQSESLSYRRNDGHGASVSRLTVEPFLLSNPEQGAGSLATSTTRKGADTPAMRAPHTPWSLTTESNTSPWQRSSSAGAQVDSESNGLRTEVERLRQEMQQIRSETLYIPPPEYQ